MIHKIKTSELKPGMYVTDLGLSPIEYPHVYSREGLILSNSEIEDIAQHGFWEAFVDEEKSKIEVDIKEAWADLIDIADHAQSAETPPIVLPTPQEVQKDLETAVSMYTSAFKTTENLFTAIEKGKPLPIEAIYEVAGSVVDNITHDSNALATVTKLQTYDNYTFTHSVNVSVLATLFGRHLNQEIEQLNQLAMAGLLHDIGKTIVPHKLLNTARPLKDTEFEIMKQHSMAGYEELKDARGVPRAVKLALLEHHERYNGTGYPLGKRGDEISYFGQILSVVDVYDALTSKRVYKPALIPYTAVSFIYSQRGQHFNPDLVDRFIQSLGVYPMGSIVLLTDGRTAVVYQANPLYPLLPVVAVVMDANGGKCPVEMLDLSLADAPKVGNCLDPTQSGVNISSILRACVWAQQKPNPQTAFNTEGVSLLGKNKVR